MKWVARDPEPAVTIPRCQVHLASRSALPRAREGDLQWFPADGGFHQCRQMAQTITLPMATKRNGSNHLSKSCWNVKGVFAGGAFAKVFLDGVVFIWSTRLSEGLPPETCRAE